MRRGTAGVGAVVALLALGADAAAAELERHSVGLTEFAGTSEVMTAHEVAPACEGTDVVEDGALQGSFASPLSGIEGVRIGRSDARGRLIADAGPASYTQAGRRSGDRTPCDPDDPGSFESSCARQVPTVPGIVGRLIDASKRRVEIAWQPTFDGAVGRYTPDFFCIDRLGPLPMPTTTIRGETCKQREYPRRLFERDRGVFELEVVCSTELVPFFPPGGTGAFGGSYRATLTVEALDEK